LASSLKFNVVVLLELQHRGAKKGFFTEMKQNEKKVFYSQVKLFLPLAA